VLGTAAAVAASLLGAATAQAAQVTIGQVGTPLGNCQTTYDFAQRTIGAGNSYVVPGFGTITGWTTAGMDAGDQMTMKVYRRLGESTLQVVGRDTRSISAGGSASNRFPTSIPVQPGDVLGLRAVNAGPCLITGATAADSVLQRTPSDLQTGESGVFVIDAPFRLNVAATFVYDNTATLASLVRDKKAGTATLTYSLPNPGDLTVAGSGARIAGAGEFASVPAGPATVVVRAGGKKRKKLKRKGKVKLAVNVTYTPTGGDPKTEPLTVNLKQKRKRKSRR
jgi:hypothetical protein